VRGLVHSWIGAVGQAVAVVAEHAAAGLQRVLRRDAGQPDQPPDGPGAW
jgi:hypothetical protein